MADPSRAELRRLQRILNDEDYGPKLVRLSRTEQRQVLDLISSGDTRRARADILALDAARREHVRELSSQRRTRPAVAPRNRWQDAADTMSRLAESRKDFVMDQGKYIAAAERFGVQQDLQHYQNLRASPDAMVLEATSAARRGNEWSVFWYHYYQ